MSGDYSVEEKLELVRQIRNRCDADRQDMNYREQIIYHLPSQERLGTKGISSIVCRTVLAVLILVLLIYADKTKQTIAGINSNRLMEMISTNCDNQILTVIDSVLDSYQSPQR